MVTSEHDSVAPVKALKRKRGSYSGARAGLRQSWRAKRKVAICL
jgi:hypothetical protein